jgi:predicted transcriptional regulator
MTIDHLKKSIRYSEKDEGQFVVVSARLLFSGDIRIDKEVLSRDRTVKQRVIESLERSILYSVYEDRRRELYDAILDLCSCNPMEYERMEKARRSLLDAAMFQSPKEYLTVPKE